MNRIRDIIQKNHDVDFVVHTQTKEELDTLIAILSEMGYTYAVPLGTLREMADAFAAEDGYDGCWRISASKGVAYNNSVEHWRLFVHDILEIQNGTIQFNDGDYTQDAARVEAKKLWKAFTDAENAAYNLELFHLDGACQDTILNWLKEKFHLENPIG